MTAKLPSHCCGRVAPFREPRRTWSWGGPVGLLRELSEPPLSCLGALGATPLEWGFGSGSGALGATLLEKAFGATPLGLGSSRSHPSRESFRSHLSWDRGRQKEDRGRQLSRQRATGGRGLWVGLELSEPPLSRDRSEHRAWELSKPRLSRELSEPPISRQRATGGRQREATLGLWIGLESFRSHPFRESFRTHPSRDRGRQEEDRGRQLSRQRATGGIVLWVGLWIGLGSSRSHASRESFRSHPSRDRGRQEEDRGRQLSGFGSGLGAFGATPLERPFGATPLETEGDKRKRALGRALDRAWELSEPPLSRDLSEPPLSRQRATGGRQREAALGLWIGLWSFRNHPSRESFPSHPSRDRGRQEEDTGRQLSRQRATGARQRSLHQETPRQATSLAVALLQAHPHTSVLSSLCKASQQQVQHTPSMDMLGSTQVYTIYTIHTIPKAYIHIWRAFYFLGLHKERRGGGVRHKTQRKRMRYVRARCAYYVYSVPYGVHNEHACVVSLCHPTAENCDLCANSNPPMLGCSKWEYWQDRNSIQVKRVRKQNTCNRKKIL